MIYSDDTLVNVMNIKRQLTYCRAGDKYEEDMGYCHQVQDIKVDNELYKHKLRSEKGLFFNFNVQNSPKRKLGL